MTPERPVTDIRCHFIIAAGVTGRKKDTGHPTLVGIV